MTALTVPHGGVRAQRMFQTTLGRIQGSGDRGVSENTTRYRDAQGTGTPISRLTDKLISGAVGSGRVLRRSKAFVLPAAGFSAMSGGGMYPVIVPPNGV